MTNFLFNKISEDVTKLLFDYQADIEEALSLVDSGEAMAISFTARVKPMSSESNEVSVKMGFTKYKVTDETEKVVVNENQLNLFQTDPKKASQA